MATPCHALRHPKLRTPMHNGGGALARCTVSRVRPVCQSQCAPPLPSHVRFLVSLRARPTRPSATHTTCSTRAAPLCRPVSAAQHGEDSPSPPCPRASTPPPPRARRRPAAPPPLPSSPRLCAKGLPPQHVPSAKDTAGPRRPPHRPARRLVCVRGGRGPARGGARRR